MPIPAAILALIQAGRIAGPLAARTMAGTTAAGLKKVDPMVKAGVAWAVPATIFSKWWDRKERRKPPENITVMPKPPLWNPDKWAQDVEDWIGSSVPFKEWLDVERGRK